MIREEKTTKKKFDSLTEKVVFKDTMIEKEQTINEKFDSLTEKVSQQEALVFRQGKGSRKA